MRWMRLFAVVAAAATANSCLDYDAAQVECHANGICVGAEDGVYFTPRQGIGMMPPAPRGDEVFQVVGDGFEPWEQSCADTLCVTGGVSP